MATERPPLLLLSAPGSRWPRLTPAEVRLLVRCGREMHASGAPCPPPANLSDPEKYYLRLAWQCAAEGDRAQKVAKGLREHYRQRRAAA